MNAFYVIVTAAGKTKAFVRDYEFLNTECDNFIALTKEH